VKCFCNRRHWLSLSNSCDKNITSLDMHYFTAVTSWILLYCSDLPMVPMQVNRSWSLWDLILRITDSLTVSEQWKIGTLCYSPSCQPALWNCLRADCPVTSHHSCAPRWYDASVLRPCRLMIKNKKNKNTSNYNHAALRNRFLWSVNRTVAEEMSIWTEFYYHLCSL